ncbi:MAG: DUF3604 domain-containing protein [Gammaproteobacteria bacterium]
MRPHATLPSSLALCLLLAACGRAPAPENHDIATAQPAAPASTAPPRVLLFGDLHIHTSLSADAFSTGNRALPDDAYRYAKGEEIRHGTGYPIRLGRPLDFAAVTDHAEYLGSNREFLNPASPLAALPIAKLFASEDPADAFKALMAISEDSSNERKLAALLDLPEVNAAAWRQVIEAAERHDEPGRFSTLIGWEWTSTPEEINLHRNVIFRSADVPAKPFSSRDSEHPEDLWAFLETERVAGREGMAIPHNSNASDGRMWSRTDSSGKPLDAAWASTRLRNEPVVEMVQIKGQSEAHPLLSADDEFANWELWNARMSGKAMPPASQPAGSYARDALKTGLELGRELGVNPFRFGMIGSSDSHNASSPVDENNYHGKLARLDGTPRQRLDRLAWNAEAVAAGRGTAYSAAGLAAVWATENRREAIYDALRRGEVYATSGPRIGLRLFGGWDFAPALTEQPDFESVAWATGVPMGSDLGPLTDPTVRAPRFAIVAARDPMGANLDRVQVVNGWLDAEGKSHERVIDVAWSGARELDPANGRLAAVGSTVDVAAASYTNDIGAAELRVVWMDPDFDPAVPAFWYVRVLEIPTPRWSTHDAKTLGEPAPEPATIQERAWSSPIWYQPAGVSGT